VAVGRATAAPNRLLRDRGGPEPTATRHGFALETQPQEASGEAPFHRLRIHSVHIAS